MDTSNLRWTQSGDKYIHRFGTSERVYGAVRAVQEHAHYIVRGMANVVTADSLEDAKQIVETLVALMNSEDS